MSRPSISERRGTFSIEFMLVAPILVTLFSGIVDYSILIDRRSMALSAVADGCVAADVAGPGGSPISAAQARVKAALTYSGLDGAHSTVIASYGSAIGDPIVVVATVPFKAVVGILPTPATFTVSSTQMRKTS